MLRTTFDDLSGGGAFLGSVDATRGNSEERIDRDLVLRRATVTNAGREFRSATALFAGYVVDAVVAENVVRGAGYTGIAVGERPRG